MADCKNAAQISTQLSAAQPRCHWRVISSVIATDEYTCHSVNVTQPYTGTTADNQLAPWQKSHQGMASREKLAW